MLWSSYHYKLLALAQQQDSLTASQKNAVQSILELLHDHEQRINLWGNPGTGKTFVAHYLDYQAEGLYACSVKDYKAFEISPDSLVIFDNAPYERKVARLIFSDVLWSRAAAVLLITRRPINDAIRKVHLELKFEETEQIKTNISKQLGIAHIETPEQYRFEQAGIWTILKSITLTKR